MVYESLIVVLEENIEALAEMWAAEVKASEYMHTYHKLSLEKLEQRGKILFENLYKWLRTGAYNEEVETYFHEIGKTRINEGFPLSEIEHALYLEKKTMWSFVIWKEEILYDLAREEMIEVMSIINNYFDLGSFYVIRGYMGEMFKHLKETGKFTDEELQKIISGFAMKNEKERKTDKTLYSEGLRKGLIK